MTDFCEEEIHAVEETFPGKISWKGKKYISTIPMINEQLQATEVWLGSVVIGFNHYAN